MKRVKIDQTLKNKIEVLDWLLDENNRHQGRTYLMAIAYINIGLRNLGKYIKVNDHYPGREADKMLLAAIYRIAKDAGLSKRLHIERDQGFIIDIETIHEFIDKKKLLFLD